ncbi:MFS transporter [Sulfitobacter mediterraneus]|uniref:MFS transporter n=1 Tax=Sulfitobacter mediterraneus TaxID=83219 RepID=UPI00193A3854|nr:MFS transporter [Sulfitobacter mediterraneus]MBM1557051.1 MFS transporter [Sulfitobacter mediterraneus]MBM1568097.1 MFS transporter [Sulfitobacter mediterraneus]MBM1572300.1 MFS transporter [Sulfitobacter mediterraneus]MBM1576089.1 MFS transporter [Sulfitobacter mediterraneus]MBM1580411.1 MFS transporter [Sulfitobacter mediterraneus]
MKTAVTTLTRAAAAMHFADQMALVAVPILAALVFDATAQTIGLLVACQSLAHLLGSLPFGLLVDRHDLRRLALVSVGISVVGAAGAAAGVAFETLLLFGASITLAGFGVVLFGLSALSILPRAEPVSALAAANARIELPRAFNAFLVPLAVGVIATGDSALWLFPLAVLVLVWGMRQLRSLPFFEAGNRTEQMSLIRQLRDGVHFVTGHSLLFSVALCAIFWNFAFAALLVAMVPAVQTLFQAPAGAFGIAMGFFGLGGFLGTWTIRRIGAWVRPNIVLLFGPGSSALAMIVVYTAAQAQVIVPLYIGFFFVGFGPAMWLIAQNSLRQVVAPPQMLGRINAVIQTAIYGVRPIGALVAGGVVGALGPLVGLALALAAFVLSFAACLFSGLRRVTSFAALAGEAA